jgi:SNF2 family DNA or RNA helicase
VYGRTCDGSNGIASKAAHVWRLTGTPAPNHADELWTHLHSAGLYEGKWDAFVQEFCAGYNSDYGFKITGVKNVDKLKALLAGFMLRRKKDEVMTLPPITFATEYLEPGEVDVRTFFGKRVLGNRDGERLLREELDELNRGLTAAIETAARAHASTDAVLGTLHGMVGSTSTLRRYVGLSLVPAYLAKVLPELASGEIDKLVVFAHHKEVIERLRWGFKDYGVGVLHGATSPKRRAAAMRAFNKTATDRVLVCQLQAAGTGINLTAACRLDFVEMSWVPGENAQAAMRIHRVGQNKPCHVRYFSLREGVHKLIADACIRKTTELIRLGL